MHDNRWMIWLGLVILFLVFKGARAVLRAAKSGSNDGMARLNAAAERILKERGVSASASNPIPRTKANPMGAKPTRGQIAAGKPRNSPAVMKAGATPAVVRRGSLLSGGREPVIQRRR
jgi:hypothetical protein